MQRGQDTLTRAAHKLAEIVYREGQAQTKPDGTGASPGASGGPKEGEVVDAEFEDLGDKK